MVAAEVRNAVRICGSFRECTEAVANLNRVVEQKMSYGPFIEWIDGAGEMAGGRPLESVENA